MPRAAVSFRALTKQSDRAARHQAGRLKNRTPPSPTVIDCLRAMLDLSPAGRPLMQWQIPPQRSRQQSDAVLRDCKARCQPRALDPVKSRHS